MRLVAARPVNGSRRSLNTKSSKGTVVAECIQPSKSGRTRLTAFATETGIYYALNTHAERATSELISWENVGLSLVIWFPNRWKVARDRERDPAGDFDTAQAVIGLHHDLFGCLRDPEHVCFKRALLALGFDLTPLTPKNSA